MEVYKTYLFSLTLAVQVGCANSLGSKKHITFPEGPLPSPNHTEENIVHRITQKLMIDGEELFVGSFMETNPGKLDKMIFILKSKSTLLATQTQASESEVLPWSTLPPQYAMEPFTLKERSINTVELGKLIQKKLYIDLYHCRNVEGYGSLVKLASVERPYLYLQVAKVESNLDSNPWVARYDIKNKKVDRLLKVDGFPYGLFIDSIYILNNLRDENKQPLFDNLYFSAKSFSSDCLLNYSTYLNQKQKEDWQPEDFFLFNQNLDSQASNSINYDAHRNNFSGNWLLPEQFRSGELDALEPWIRNLRIFGQVYKNDLSVQLGISFEKDKGERR